MAYKFVSVYLSLPMQDFRNIKIITYLLVILCKNSFRCKILLGKKKIFCSTSRIESLQSR